MISYKPWREESSSSSSFLARFKGVVLQQNGHWGAQIYANHQRIWLGTFKSEKSAAMAYDRAAMKLRLNDDLHLNTPWTDLTNYELSFQDLHATDAVLAMIRDGSYESKFNEFMKTIGKVRPDDRVDPVPVCGRFDGKGITFHELFQKELTPSDVGKLNRLVIPKKHAVKYFPYIQASDKEGESEGDKELDSGAAEGLMLQFKDRLDRAWEFRYCYWKSSQSFVFTKGWNKFVKTNNLRAKDTVAFYRCEDREGLKRPFCVIDVGHNSGGNVVLGLGCGGSYEAPSVGITEKEVEEEEEGEIVEEKKAVWLFGVRIS